jgi:hypothetical protein
MRDLTEEELKLAPDWATHYQFGVIGNLIFISLRKMLAWNVNTPLSMAVDLEYCSHLVDKHKPIERKPFDITKYEFSEGLSISNMCKLSVEIEFKDNDDCNYVPLHKDDVIAIAKALGVTAKDLA